MKSRRAASIAKEAVLRDVGRLLRAGENVIQIGDTIRLWSFSDDVTERFGIRYDINWDRSVLNGFQNALAELEVTGRTSLPGAILTSLERFAEAESGPLNLFIYTDGKDAFSFGEAEAIMELYRDRFEGSSRLPNFVLVHVAREKLPEGTTNLISTLGGRTIANAGTYDLNPVVRPAPVAATLPDPPTVAEVAPAEPIQKEPPASPPAPEPPVVNVSPTTFQLTVMPGAESVRAVPLEFTVKPPQPGLLVGVTLERVDWPEGMTMQLLSDRFATEGKQSISFAIKNAQPGVHHAVVRFTGTAKLEPPQVPVRLEVLPPKPEVVRVQFYPEQIPPIEIGRSDQWQDIRDVGFMLVYGDSANDVKVRFDWTASPEVELRVVSVPESGNPIAAGEVAPLSRVGRLARFQIRRTDIQEPATMDAGTIRVSLVEGQHAVLSGTNSMVVPFARPIPFQLRLETGEIALGDLKYGVEKVTRSLAMETEGNLDGQKIRLRLEGTALAGVKIRPEEVDLAAGKTNLQVEFSGMETRKPGAVEGFLVVTLIEPTVVGRRTDLSPDEFRVPIFGQILEPGSVALEIENPMVAGQPIRIRARSQPEPEGGFKALIQSPGADGTAELPLSDNGAADAGDERAGDGIYSGVLKGVSGLGLYQVKVVGSGAHAGIESHSAELPIYFQPPAQQLTGRLVDRNRGEFIEFKFPLLSDFPAEIPIVTEPVSGDVPLNSFVSSKYLRRGENELDLVVTVNEDARSGEYNYEIRLAAEPMPGMKATIPVQVRIEVVSFAQYFVRLMAVAVGIAFAVFLVFFGPWRTYFGRPGDRRRRSEPAPSER